MTHEEDMQLARALVGAHQRIEPSLDWLSDVRWEMSEATAKRLIRAMCSDYVLSSWADAGLPITLLGLRVDLVERDGVRLVLVAVD